MSGHLSWRHNGGMHGLARPPNHSRRKLSLGLRAWPFRGGPPCRGRAPMCRRVRAADLDIYRTVNVLVKEYGSEEAPLMAAKRDNGDAPRDMTMRMTTF